MLTGGGVYKVQGDLEKGRTKQAKKQLHDFLKHLSRSALRDDVKERLVNDAETVLENW